MAEDTAAVRSDRSRQLADLLTSAEPALRRLAQRLCPDGIDVHDLVQDTFERAMRRGIPPEVRSPQAWLATVMHNLFIDRCRAAARRPAPEMLEDDHGHVVPLEPDADEPAWTGITTADVRAALEQIGPVYRDVYRMHTFEHLSYKQIAEQLQIEPFTVGTRLCRARKRLRDLLDKRFGLEVS